MTKDEQNAQDFFDLCKKLGWVYLVKPTGVVSITKKFTPGDSNAYCDCDSESYTILSKVPLKGGSIWGTDSGSIGGHIGLTNGYYTLNKSGNGAARFIKALKKL